ncbi:protein DEPP [Coregonus clupeaformis]|uniref:protein DEPP n=1 Tax=Coregonus clupeaformis TaxID=59861 RepID=UPI001BDFC862|nr:protein DEPP [Coregonus clupeaformis]
MKHRRLLLSLPHLPTITETLEDSETLGVPGHPAHLAQSVSQSPSQCSQSLEEYMTSIQALARPVAHPSCGPVRLQRMGRPRLFSKPQMKHSVSASLPRGSPRAIRTRTTSPITPTGQAPEQLSGRLGKERECGGRDPMEWLYGQTHTQTETRTHTPSRTQMRTY